jgi:hypothetical protein
MRRSHTILPVMLLLITGLVAPAVERVGAQDEAKPDPVIADFLKYYPQSDTEARRDLVARMVKVQTPECVAALVKYALQDPEYAVREEAANVLARMEPKETQAAVVEALSHGKETVREGAALALGKMKHDGEPPVEVLCKVVSSDRSVDVVAAAAESLGAIGSKKATPALVELARSRAEILCIAAADALSLLKDEAAAGTLIELLGHRSWRVQVAALNALGATRSKKAIDPLIEYLDAAEGRPREDARRALMRTTQRTFGMDAKTWRDWWDRVKDTWEVPPEKEVEDDDPGRGYARKPTRYHRITTFSDKIIFAIDISTSMEDPIQIKAGVRSQEEKYQRRWQGTRKLEIAREELAFCLRGLDPETKFNVIAFETDVRTWKRAPVSATSGNVQAAIRWIMKQKARRPSTSGMKTSSGRGADGMVIGRTNTYACLRQIFGLKGLRGKGRTTRGHGGGPKPRWDTCFFLSDGTPTEGEITNIEEILDEVRRWNRSAKMVIHTIGMNETGSFRTLMDGLARITGGKAVYVGK